MTELADAAKRLRVLSALQTAIKSFRLLFGVKRCIAQLKWELEILERWNKEGNK